MAIINPFIWANKGGIIRLEATSVSVGASEVTYTFQPHRFLDAPYSGLMLLKLPAYTAPTTAVPVVFATGSRTQAVTTLNGDAVTSANLSGSGVYLAYYENGVLQVLTGLTA